MVGSKLLERSVMAVCVVSVGLGACRSKPTPALDNAGSDSGSSVLAPAASKQATKPLPPEPPPPLAGKYDAGGLESMSEIVAKNPALKDIWSPSRREALNVLLTLLAMTFETLQDDGKSTLPGTIYERAKALKLEEAYLSLEMHVSMRGKLPEEFMSSLREHLTSGKAEPHLGVWQAATKPGETWFDYSALASWANREDPAYLREHIAARSKGGTVPWSDGKKPVHRWLAWEDMALAWLGMQLQRTGTTLAPAEQARFDELTTSPLGRPALTEDVDLAALLAEYRSNEVRADAKFKGHVIRVGCGSIAAREIDAGSLG